MTGLARPRIALAMDETSRERFFPRARLARLDRIGEIDSHLLTRFDTPESRESLADATVLLTGWHAPRIGADALDRAPNLQAIVHSGGSVKGHVGPECWERGIRISSQAGANAVPVAEYTVATIVLANKAFLPLSRDLSRERGEIDPGGRWPEMGNYGRTVGIIGASRIGRLVIAMLASYDLDVLLYDPFVGADEAAEMGVRVVTLDDLLQHSDVVSIHAPELPETHHLLDERRLRLLKDGATLINTARGSLVDSRALERVIVSQPLFAVLDVTDPEPLPSSSPLYEHPNVILTPHIAGSLGNELSRLADGAIDEIARFARGEALLHEVRFADLARLA